MSIINNNNNLVYLKQFTSRKVGFLAEEFPDSLSMWMESYIKFAVAGVRSENVKQKIGESSE